MYVCTNINKYIIRTQYICYLYLPVVTIIIPPESTTVLRGNDVTISCGYGSATALPVTWIINGTSFTHEEIVNSPLYQLNNPFSPVTFSLTVFSINGTTTFQCVVLSTTNTTSTRGTVTVINGGMYIICSDINVRDMLICLLYVYIST